MTGDNGKLVRNIEESTNKFGDHWVFGAWVIGSERYPAHGDQRIGFGGVHDVKQVFFKLERSLRAGN